MEDMETLAETITAEGQEDEVPTIPRITLDEVRVTQIKTIILARTRVEDQDEVQLEEQVEDLHMNITTMI